MTPTFWHNKRVLITGHTGFKGGWLTLWLQSMGAKISGISLEPNTTPNLFTLADIQSGIDHHIQDIRDAPALSKIIKDFDPEIVFHMAAQPLVRASYKDPLGNFDTNIMGTANVLEALRACPSIKTVVVITTDKVYENLEVPTPYKENDHLGGHDPYSASKAAAEIVTQSYRKSFFMDKGVRVVTARSGNVIGGGDWSEDRLIPDAVKAWQNGKTLEIRAPQSVRPWQHVLDPLAGYILLAENTTPEHAYNFGPDNQKPATVRDVIDLARASYGKGDVHYHTNNEGPHEAGLLLLDIAKAKKDLGFQPKWDLKTSINKTMEWYKKIENGIEARTLCLEQINRHCEETS